jgi:hypothetical protein
MKTTEAESAAAADVEEFDDDTPGSRLEELARMAALDPDELLDLLSVALRRGPVATTGVDALSTAEVSTLRAAGVDLTGPPEGADAQVSTVGELARLIGEALDTDEAGTLLNVTPGRVRQRLASRHLHGIRAGSAWRIPRWQFPGGAPLPGLDKVVPALPGALHPLAIEHLMTSPHVDLMVGQRPISPVEWLASGGDPDRVARLVAHVPALP